MTQQFLNIQGAQMAYLQFGSGPDLLIAIPGYGDRAVLFEKLKNSLSPKYTVYALQLPGHGESHWNRRFFSKKDFAEAIELIKLKEGKKEVTLMGFSFGARVVCALLQDGYTAVKEIFLLAPDGFNKAYIRRATFLPKPVRYALQATLNNPAWYVGLAKALHQIGLLKKYSLHFVERHLATKKRRVRLFLYWNSMDDFQYDEREVGLLLEKNKIETTLVLGAKDKVIPTAAWKNWGEGLKGVKVHMLYEGHNLVGEGLGELLMEE